MKGESMRPPKNRRLPYKKMIEAIDKLVDNDWGFEMIDLKHDLHSKKKNAYLPFTQEEAIEMSEALGKIYQIAHCVHCCCYPKV